MIFIKEYNGNTLFLILGLESQQEVHYRMPLRHMLYDALRYNQQCNQLMRQHKKKRDWNNNREFLSGISNCDRLQPVITICVYWGEKSWNGPRNLHEMLDISSEIAQYKDRIGNYSLNLLEVRKIEDLETYDGELKGLLGFVKYQKDKDSLERFVEENEKMFRNLTAETVIAMSTLGNSRELQKHILKIKDRSNTSGEEARIDMCQAIREMIEDGRIEGRREGRREGRKEGYDSINSLHHKLLDDNRLDDLRRSTVDPEYQQLLFREYGLLPTDDISFV